MPSSIKDLEEASGTKIKDLHKPEIDDVLVTCKKCSKKAKRVSEVLDSWIEAGSASFAERHYPFEKGLKLEEFFPPDFITEYTGQIRAWFYVLHVISNALFKSNAFKNVLVTGVILGTDGRKMSKNFGNYPDPKEMLSKYGGDALRLYLMSTPVMRGEDALISEEQYRNQVKNFLLLLWNTYNYFVTYSNLTNWEPNKKDKVYEKSILDKWILVLQQELVNNVTNDLEGYDTVSYVEHLQGFLSHLSTWYLRRSRGRKDDGFYETFYEVLKTFCKLAAPIAPFVTEEIYGNLTKEESVHLSFWPDAKTLKTEDKKLLREMEEVRKIVEKVHALRKEGGIALRQPLNEFTIYNLQFTISDFEELIKDEVNVKKIDIKTGKGEVKLDTNITSELKAEGEMRDIVRKIQEERKNIGTKLDELVVVTLPEWPKEFEDEIKKRALVAKITKGEFNVKR